MSSSKNISHSVSRTTRGVPADFRSVFDIVSTTMGVSTELRAAHICELARKQLQKLLPGSETQYKVVSFHGQTLKISALNSVIAQRIQFKSHFLLEEINRQLKSDTLKKILVKPGTAEVPDYS